MTEEELKAYQAGQFINQIGNAIKNGVIEEIESNNVAGILSVNKEDTERL